MASAHWPSIPPAGMRDAFAWAACNSNSEQRTDGTGVSLRVAELADASVILSLVRELATFEREPDAVITTVEMLERDGFGPSPLFHTLLASRPGSTEVVGLALCYVSYSTWTGPCLYLEDLYVSPSARRRGIARALFKALARASWVTGCARLHWNVLKWNTPAIEFYESPVVAAEQLAEWVQYRLDRRGIAHVAQLVPAAPECPGGDTVTHAPQT